MSRPVLFLLVVSSFSASNAARGDRGLVEAAEARREYVMFSARGLDKNRPRNKCGFGTEGAFWQLTADANRVFFDKVPNDRYLVVTDVVWSAVRRNDRRSGFVSMNLKAYTSDRAPRRFAWEARVSTVPVRKGVTVAIGERSHIGSGVVFGPGVTPCAVARTGGVLLRNSSAVLHGYLTQSVEQFENSQ